MGDPDPGHARVLRPADIETLLGEVRRTRTAQHEAQQQGGATFWSMRSARLASLTALETYAGVLDRNGWPVPPRMRFDIQLLRSLCGRTTLRQ